MLPPRRSVIPEPGKRVTGIDAIRDAWTGLVASKTRVVIESHEAIESGDVALYCTRWSLSGTGPDGTDRDKWTVRGCLAPRA